jgi:hypothetical protein
MLKAKRLPGYFWGEAVSSAVHILNRSPTRALAGKTPFEAWYGERPHVHYLRTFGCIEYVKNTRPHLKKLDDRSSKKIFVGYESGSKAWRFYSPDTGCVTVSRDVVFDEAAQWNWGEPTSDGDANDDSEPFTVEYYVEHPGATEVEEEAQNTPTAPEHMSTSSPQLHAWTPAPHRHSAPAATTSRAPVPSVTFASPPPDSREY